MRHAPFDREPNHNSGVCRCHFPSFYVLGWVEPSVSSSLVFGAALHAALEHHFRALVQGDPPPSVDRLLASFRHGCQFIVLTKTRSPVVQQFTIPADEARVARARAVARRVWRAIAAGHFYPAPSPLACGGCPFREPCRGWTG